MEYRFRPPTGSPAERGAAPPAYRRTVADGMIIERDAARLSYRSDAADE